MPDDIPENEIWSMGQNTMLKNGFAKTPGYGDWISTYGSFWYYNEEEYIGN